MKVMEGLARLALVISRTIFLIGAIGNIALGFVNHNNRLLIIGILLAFSFCSPLLDNRE